MIHAVGSMAFLMKLLGGDTKMVHINGVRSPSKLQKSIH